MVKNNSHPAFTVPYYNKNNIKDVVTFIVFIFPKPQNPPNKST